MAEEQEGLTPQQPTDPTKIAVGHILAITHYVKVTALPEPGVRVNCLGLDDGLTFGVQGSELLKRCRSADSYQQEEPVTRTRMAEILSTSYGTVFTAGFVKLGGESRTLRGRLLSTVPLMGRSMVEDLDLPGPAEKRIRQIDHRTLQSLVVNGVKFVLKK